MPIHSSIFLDERINSLISMCSFSFPCLSRALIGYDARNITRVHQLDSIVQEGKYCFYILSLVGG